MLCYLKSILFTSSSRSLHQSKLDRCHCCTCVLRPELSDTLDVRWQQFRFYATLITFVFDWLIELTDIIRTDTQTDSIALPPALLEVTSCRRAAAMICLRPALQRERAAAALSQTGRAGPDQPIRAIQPAGSTRRPPTRCTRQTDVRRQTASSLNASWAGHSKPRFSGRVCIQLHTFTMRATVTLHGSRLFSAETCWHLTLLLNYCLSIVRSCIYGVQWWRTRVDYI